MVNIKGATKDRNVISKLIAEFKPTDESGNIIEGNNEENNLETIEIAGPIQMSESNAVVIAEYINKAEADETRAKSMIENDDKNEH